MIVHDSWWSNGSARSTIIDYHEPFDQGLIPHDDAECGIENFKLIVTERVQVNLDNSRAVSALTFLLFSN